MPEEIKMRMARAYPDQVQRVREWFQKLDELLDDEKSTSDDYGRWISGHYHEVANDWERILFGYDTLIENVCDQTKSYLEFKPEILDAFALANEVGELVAAAEKVYEMRNMMQGQGPSALIVALAMMDLQKAVQKVKQGSASKPSEDRLYKTARTMLDLYDRHGPEQFKRRFGTLNILDACWQIIGEGEGNPHPWPDQK
jgi:hypothetical protein